MPRKSPNRPNCFYAIELAPSIVGCVAALVESKRAVLCYYGCVLALFLLIVITLVIGIIYRYILFEV